MATKTSKFGTGKREAHDSSDFYGRSLYADINGSSLPEPSPASESLELAQPIGSWADHVYCHTSTNMSQIPAASVGLAFTSPPYNVGKDYDDDLGMNEYLDLIAAVGREVYRVLMPGGRYVVNIANLGRRPYIPLHSKFYSIHDTLGFATMGEIIWQKGKGASGSCAWGSWMSAKAPSLRDIHEYLLIFTKEGFKRPDKGKSDISREEFMQATLSIWQIPPESAKRVGHPAPFPVELAERVVRLYSYVGDVVLDPFVGSGTTCIAALKNNRHYVGYDISEHYCEIAQHRLEQCSISIAKSE